MKKLMRRLGTRIAVIAMVLIAAIVGTVLALLMSTTIQFVDGLIYHEADVANKSFLYKLEALQAEARERAEMIAGSNEIVDAVERRDHAALLSALGNLSAGLDLITLCDAEGTVLARTHSDKTGDSVLSQQAISTALNTGRGISTIEPGTVIGFSTRGSAAIKDASGRIIGALTCGHDLSQSKYIDEVKAQSGSEATLFFGDERMATTLVDEAGNRATGSKAPANIVQTVLTEKKDYSGRMDLFGNVYSAYYSPIVINGQALGMVFTGVSIENALAQERGMVLMIAVSMVMLLLAVLITALVIKSATKKAYWYESMLDSIPFPISVTDMDMNWTFINKPVEDMLNLKRADVLGKPCSSWGAAICNTDNCGIRCLQHDKFLTFFEQMGMDFQVNIAYLNDARGKKQGHIEIVQDITKTVETQKAQTELVTRINEISGAFVDASRQIADGASSLAQGSTQQSASVEELSASISDMANKTKNNAEMANRAAELAKVIMTNAEKGSRQMNEMMLAVREINEASQGINKVIKVIDDIAFQTNILALNAAVEAARAGQHGKGFAVVAEEVRSLAAKSAEAAQNTGVMIANSIEKAEMGSNIAGETAGSLNEILEGINESSRLVGDIAQFSGEQSMSIAQINTGINQVAQVVQQNSAIAQQSAAAAQQLSGQSNQLGELLASFNAQSLGEGDSVKRLSAPKQTSGGRGKY